MADGLRMALVELFEAVQLDGNIGCLSMGAWVVNQALMKLEVTQQVGADRHEHNPHCSGQRNGCRERQWDTRVGTIALQVPRVREGGFMPSLLEPRKRAVHVYVAVVQDGFSGLWAGSRYLVLLA